MSVLYALVLVVLAVAAALCLLRMLRAESFPDRIVALDMLLVVLVCGVAVDAARTDTRAYLDVLVVASLLGFTGTSLIARFVERRGAR